jgi:hypothetical protein
MNGDTPESGRLLVVESEIRRHESWLEDHDKRLATNEKCNDASLRLEDMIKNEVLPALKSLNECKIANEAVAKAKIPFWESAWGTRIWDVAKLLVVALITWGVTVNQFMAGK